MSKDYKSVIVMLALIGIVIFSRAASAQSNWLGSLEFTAGFPQGEMKDQLDRNAYGGGGRFFFAPDKSPFAIGAGLTFMNYGSESRREPFSTTIPDVTVNVTTSNNIVQGFLIFRTHMPSGPIRPYGDALIGFNYLFTETKISDADDSSEEVASSKNQDDAAFAYGCGGGFMVPFYTSKSEQQPITVSFDIGGHYLRGGEAEYLKEGSIRRENGTVTYDLIKSRTDMIMFQAGVSIQF